MALAAHPETLSAQKQTFKANNFVPILIGKISILDLASGVVYLVPVKQLKAE